MKRYLTNEFDNIDWSKKLGTLLRIIYGLMFIHDAKIIHRDLHSGNILKGNYRAKISDFGLSKSSIVSTGDDEIYGVVPYVAPEIFQGKKYTTASDIYSFGMIM